MLLVKNNLLDKKVQFHIDNNGCFIEWLTGGNSKQIVGTDIGTLLSFVLLALIEWDKRYLTFWVSVLIMILVNHVIPQGLLINKTIEDIIDFPQLFNCWFFCNSSHWKGHWTSKIQIRNKLALFISLYLQCTEAGINCWPKTWF